MKFSTIKISVHKFILSVFIVMFANLFFPAYSKNLISKSGNKKNNHKKQFNDIGVTPKFTLSKETSDPRYPNLSYYIVPEDNSSRPIIRHPYRDQYAVEIRPKIVGFLTQNL